ncbi:MAG: TIGR03936 family radical SAM-associated protein [Dehalococcoidia bacterium]|nr:TIGR03936 family radical SAM-associated protein [Dehalococcoidia bacterium]
MSEFSGNSKVNKFTRFSSRGSAPSNQQVIFRLRLKFERVEELKYISHLDLMRLWERALRRAKLPLAYSEGFTPHPRISLAAPLALGVTSEAELMDIFLERRIPSSLIATAVPPQLPPGIKLLETQVISPSAPSLQSIVRFAEYRVLVTSSKNEAEVTASMDSLLSAESLPWQHNRDTGPRRYDLRPLIEDLWLIRSQEDDFLIGMRLVLGSQGAGRPEQVTAALGFSSPPVSIHRTGLLLTRRESDRG